MTKFFYERMGVNSDIKRHRDYEKYLNQKIHALENTDGLSDFEIRALRTYRHVLAQLWGSKARLVENIGRK